MRILLLILASITLVACVDRGAIKVVPEAAQIGMIQPVFIGSTRAPDQVEALPFGIARQAELRFARVDVSIPPDHKVGKIDWPRKGVAPNPATSFVAADQQIYGDGDAFRHDLSQVLRANDGEAVLFVHGFNNSFSESTYRVAQLGHDLKVKAAMVHYAWPSRANALGYVYDRDSALFARDGLEELIHQVEAAGARRIIIVAHSMGGGIVMETLRQMRIGGQGATLSRIAGVVLMSPDIDVDVFHEQAMRIGQLPQPFLIFTSKKDRALALSARLTGQKDRVGNLQNPAELGDLKVTLIDTTAFSSGFGHFNVGNSAALLSILGGIVDVDTAFAADKTGHTGLLGGVVLSVQSATQIILYPASALAQQFEQ